MRKSKLTTQHTRRKFYIDCFLRFYSTHIYLNFKIDMGVLLVHSTTYDDTKMGSADFSGW